MFIPISYWKGVRSAQGIVAAIEHAVANHALEPGDRLPTVRELATQLGVAPNTVAAAYRTLGGRGIVTGRGRQGTHISAGPALPARPDPVIPAGVRNLADGNPDPKLLPPWRHALRHIDASHLSYGEAKADREDLVQLAVDWFRADAIPADRVVVVAGALDGVERVLGAHLRPGDRVAVEDPGFPRVFDLVGALGLIGLPLQIDERGPIPESLERVLADGANAIVLTPRAQNPTGAAIDAARGRVLARILTGYPEVLVIEDDHAGPIAGDAGSSIDGTGVVTLAHARRERWAVVRSVAKSLGPDLRLALLTGDRTTLDRVEGRLRLGTGWVSHLLQELVVELWADPATQDHLERARTTYADRRGALIEALADHDVPATGPTGLNVWVPVPEEETVIAGLHARGWAVAGGERFRLHSGPAIRITTATLTPPEARRLAVDLAAAMDPTPRRGASV